MERVTRFMRETAAPAAALACSAAACAGLAYACVRLMSDKAGETERALIAHADSQRRRLQKLRMYFESAQLTSNDVALKRMEAVSHQLKTLLTPPASAEIRAASGEQRLALFEEMKLRILTHLVALPYVQSYCALLVRAQVNVISNHVYLHKLLASEEAVEDDGDSDAPRQETTNPIDEIAQNEFLTFVEAHVQKEMLSFVQQVRACVEQAFAESKLDRPLEFGAFQRMLLQARNAVEQQQQATAPRPLAQLMSLGDGNSGGKEEEPAVPLRLDAVGALVAEMRRVTSSQKFFDIVCSSASRRFFHVEASVRQILGGGGGGDTKDGAATATVAPVLASQLTPLCVLARSELSHATLGALQHITDDSFVQDFMYALFTQSH
eukprot:TRINITY_DN5668_c0_g1_i1.p2 TRINITY_DN5668_c0_g1~~TRINITY_DN5668_c0_g1_i1.p2  ORF type:complete len:396 (-),score=121.55 TRINITY_DN5668_c0_g1_i1:1274-2413(-)